MAWLYSNQWAAGFFDGEGNVYIRHRGRKNPEIHAQITQKDPRPLQEIHFRFGGSISKTKNPANCWRWRCACQNAARFFEAILPHSFVKREAIEKALKTRKPLRKYKVCGSTCQD